MLFFRGKDLNDVERLLGIMQSDLDRAYVRAALVEVVGEEGLSRSQVGRTGSGAVGDVTDLKP